MIVLDVTISSAGRLAAAVPPIVMAHTVAKITRRTTLFQAKMPVARLRSQREACLAIPPVAPPADCRIIGGIAFARRLRLRAYEPNSLVVPFVAVGSRLFLRLSVALVPAAHLARSAAWHACPRSNLALAGHHFVVKFRR